MNEEIKKCVESMQNAIAELRAMKYLTIGDIYTVKHTYGLSNETVQLIFSL